MLKVGDRVIIKDMRGHNLWQRGMDEFIGKTTEITWLDNYACGIKGTGYLFPIGAVELADPEERFQREIEDASSKFCNALNTYLEEMTAIARKAYEY